MQIGDTVLVHRQSRPYERDKLAIGKIVGETKTSWRVEYGDGLGRPIELFRKTDLHWRSGDAFSSTRISPYNQDEWRTYERELLRMTVINQLTRFDWKSIDTDTLIKIHSEAVKAKHDNRKIPDEIKVVESEITP